MIDMTISFGLLWFKFKVELNKSPKIWIHITTNAAFPQGGLNKSIVICLHEAMQCDVALEIVWNQFGRIIFELKCTGRRCIDIGKSNLGGILQEDWYDITKAPGNFSLLCECKILNWEENLYYFFVLLYFSLCSTFFSSGM